MAGMSRCVHNLLSGGNKHIAICACLHVQAPRSLTSLTNTAEDCKQQHSCPKIVCNLVTSMNKSCVYLQKEQICFTYEKPMYCLRGNQIYADWQSDTWSIRYCSDSSVVSRAASLLQTEAEVIFFTVKVLHLQSLN